MDGLLLIINRALAFLLAIAAGAVLSAADAHDKPGDYIGLAILLAILALMAGHFAYQYASKIERKHGRK